MLVLARLTGQAVVLVLPDGRTESVKVAELIRAADSLPCRVRLRVAGERADRVRAVEGGFQLNLPDGRACHVTVTALEPDHPVGPRAKLGFDVPQDVAVYRNELLAKILRSGTKPGSHLTEGGRWRPKP